MALQHFMVFCLKKTLIEDCELITQVCDFCKNAIIKAKKKYVLQVTGPYIENNLATKHCSCFGCQIVFFNFRLNKYFVSDTK